VEFFIERDEGVVLQVDVVIEDEHVLEGVLISHYGV
jgi:hypothetical protein